MLSFGLAGLLFVSGGTAEAADSATEAAPPPWQAAVAAQVREAANAPRARLSYHVLAAEVALARDRTGEAATQYARALALDPDVALAERAARVAAAADRPDLAYSAVRIWAREAPDALPAQRAAVRLALVNGDAAGMGEYIPRLVAAAHSPRDGYTLVARLLSGRPAHADAAITALRDLSRQHPDAAAPAYATALLALGYNKLDIAADAAARAHANAPDWGEAGMLVAAIAVRQGNAKAAADAVAALPGDAKVRAGYHIGLARFLLQAGQADRATEEFKAALDVAPDNTDARFGLGLLSLSQGDTQTARKQFRQLIDDGERTADAAFYLGVIAQQDGRIDDARRWYGHVGSGAHVFEAGMRDTFLIARSGDLDGALARLDRLQSATSGHDNEIISARGELLVRDGQLKKALALFNQALADAPDDSDLRYARSLVYERLGRIDAARADLEQVLDNDSDDARALNALGYLLTNHSQDYQRAERLIRQALSQDPDNPAVLDSLGWVLYKQGALTEARKPLEQAHEGSDDPEIALHLGTVRWAQGDHAAARRIWAQAAQNHPDNTELKQIMEEHRS
ncbi:tetratricopeptide repeat protein [Salinisphaera sp. Q1T1-3]|uniref:tetratricopeptide repeat protein n=1 Tax=Salinisphaera sp. Q1T1-3 TaxID=2321229 RepID=UPI0013144A4C|nr:tetratricopeptide repeat protein [Salinisphaera sp. Q1T1-3]